VLDEPTNHLDVAACEILEQALASFAGTVLFVSHDRSFINAIATRVVEIRPGRVQSFPGNYDDYLRKLAASTPTTAESAPAAPAATKAERIAARSAARARRKAAERIRRKLSASESEIQTAEQALVELGDQLADPEVYRNGERVREIEAERSALQQRIDGLYRDWEDLAVELERAEQR